MTSDPKPDDAPDPTPETLRTLYRIGFTARQIARATGLDLWKVEQALKEVTR